MNNVWNCQGLSQPVMVHQQKAINPISTKSGMNISTSLPPNWIPETVIMEGMFLINITPWSAHTNMANFLLRQHILPHFRNRSMEVHLLFDDPERQGQSPK